MKKFKVLLNDQGESFEFKTVQQIEKFINLIDPDDKIERIDIGLLTMTKRSLKAGQLVLCIGNQNFITTPEYCYAIYRFLKNKYSDICENLDQVMELSYWWDFGKSQTCDNVNRINRTVTFYPTTDADDFSLDIHFDIVTDHMHASLGPTIEIMSITKNDKELKYTAEKIDNSEAWLVSIEGDDDFGEILVSRTKVEVLDKSYINEYGIFVNDEEVKK